VIIDVPADIDGGLTDVIAVDHGDLLIRPVTIFGRNVWLYAHGDGSFVFNSDSGLIKWAGVDTNQELTELLRVGGLEADVVAQLSPSVPEPSSSLLAMIAAGAAWRSLRGRARKRRAASGLVR
jgi:hypothetical protein